MQAKYDQAYRNFPVAQWFEHPTGVQKVTNLTPVTKLNTDHLNFVINNLLLLLLPYFKLDTKHVFLTKSSKTVESLK